MTIQDLIDWFGLNQDIVFVYYGILLMISLIGLLFVKPSRGVPIRTMRRPHVRNSTSFSYYIYSALVYAVVVPGLLSLILLLYGFFFLHLNLLEVNALAYFLPLVSMVVLLVIIQKTIALKLIPGFDKLSGLFMMVIVSFLLTYTLQRISIGIYFIGSASSLGFIFVGFLVLLRLGWSKIMK